MTDALREWVADQTGLTTVWLNPNAPRPARPYASIQITNSARVGQAYVGPLDPDDKAPVRFDRDVTISVSVYEAADNPDPRSAFQRAESLRDSLDLRGVRDSLYAEGWALRSTDLLTDAPQMLDTQWEPRAVFDATFGTRSEILDDLGFVDQINITGDASGQTVIDEEVTA